MDRFEAIAAFQAVADAGGFSAASRRLNVPLTTLSRRVADLEAHLKVRLFTRTTRQVTLTEAGRQFRDAARRLLEDLDAAERMAAGMDDVPRGNLIVTAPIVFGRVHLLPVVNAYLAMYPDMSVTLVLHDRIVDLVDEGIDCAVRIGTMGESSLRIHALGSITPIVCASPRYLARRGRPGHPRELSEHDCINFARQPGQTSWNFRDGADGCQVEISARLTVNTAEAALDAALADGGVTQLYSYQAAQALAPNRLQLVLQAYAPPDLPVQLVFPAGRFMPAKLRSFIDFAAPRLKHVLSDVSARLAGANQG